MHNDPDVVSAAQLIRSGQAQFFHKNGQPSFLAKDIIAEQVVRDEVRRRASVFVEKMPPFGKAPPLQLIPGPRKRWGECLSCGDELLGPVTRGAKIVYESGHTGGECQLCIAGLRAALRETGRL